MSMQTAHRVSALVWICLGLSLGAQGPVINALPNGGFELVEPGPAGPLIPRAWTLRPPDTDQLTVTSREDGGRCLKMTGNGVIPAIRYDGLPLAGTATWALAFESRGEGAVRVQVHACDDKAWGILLDETPESAPDWRRHRFAVTPPTTASELRIQFAGKGTAYLDNVVFGHAALPALDLPPATPLTRDSDTLLLLDFETDLDPFQFFTKGEVNQAAPGRYGRGLRQGAGAYVATSAEDFLDARAGTIELWVKLLVPGSERVGRPIVSVPGMRGLSLCRDQYGHFSFSLQRHWGTGVRIWGEGYARTWEPGVWRHVAACWDQDLVQLWVDGRLLDSAPAVNLPDSFGPELRLGAPGMVIDSLRISRTVRYRFPVAH